MEKIKKIFQAFKNFKISQTVSSDLQCPDCKINLLEDSGYLSLGICSACGHKDTLSAKQWINLIFDQNSFDEKFLNIDSMLRHLSDPINNKMCSGCFNSNYRQKCNQFIDW